MIQHQPIPMANSLTETAPGRIAVRGYLATDPYPDRAVASYSELGAWVQAQDATAPLVIDIDSPGGDISGIEELCSIIRGHAGPTVARVSGQAASAAYWVSLACDRIEAVPSALIGSIGAMLPGGKVDTSALDVVATLSPRKNAPDEQWQEVIDAAAERFLAYVRDRRGWGEKDLSAVAARCGDGKLMTAAEALSTGLIDTVEAPMDEPQVPEVVEERSAEERLRELEERYADLERRVMEVEAIVANLKREKDDTAADEQQVEAEPAAAQDKPCSLAALSRDINQIKRAQRDSMIAGLVACGRLQQADVEIARVAYDANPAAFERRYGRASPMSVPVRLSSGQAVSTVAAKPADPTQAAFAALGRGEYKTFVEAYKACGGR